MAINFFILDFRKTGPPDFKFAIIFDRNCFVLKLFHGKYLVRPPSWIDFRKNYLLVHVTRVTSGAGENRINEIYFIRCNSGFLTSSE